MTAIDVYFAAADPPFWLWQDEGNVVAWSDGPTIAFRNELATVFERLRTQSLPPFGAVVLLMAACRDNWNDAPGRLGILAGILSAGKRNDRLELLNRVGAGLDRVRAMSSAMRTPANAKAELAAMVFEGQGDATLPAAYDALIDALTHGLPELKTPPHQRNPVDRLLRDLAWLDRGLARVNETALALRVKIGTEQLPVPAKLDAPPLKTSPGLLAELQDDPELGGIARLAKLLLAVVQMPRPLSSPEELSIGGVSDISNRGALDRLLLSELANDGLTLAVRVAMNEALYLRREAPPRTPTRRRLILLDAGLRMWGVPRIFATAVGLALSIGAEAGTEVVAYRTSGDGPTPIDLSTKAGLTEHLAALDPQVHPGGCLPELAAIAAAANESTNDKQAAIERADVLLVTGDDVLADRNFQSALAEADFAEIHLATVNRAGEFELCLHTRRGRKRLRRAQFALDDILQPPSKPTVKLLELDGKPLPAIFQAMPFPLRLCCPIDTERSWHVKDLGAFSYTRDGRLLHWIAPEHGARQIAELLPPGNLHWAATRSLNNSHVVAVIGKLSRHGLHILEIDAATGTHCIQRLELDVEQPKSVFVHDGVLFAADAAKIGAYSLASGKLLATKSIDGWKHAGGRIFFFDHAQPRLWKLASFTGDTICFPTFHRDSLPNPKLVGVFESADQEGPIGVLKSGNLLNLERNQERKIESLNRPMFDSATTMAVSRDGTKLLLTASGGSRKLVDVRTLSCSSVVNGGPQDLEPELFAVAKPIALRHRFHAIGVDTQGRLTLVGRRDGYWPFEYDERAKTLRFASHPAATTLRVRRNFTLLESNRSDSYSLSEAVFADGSRAVLDGRGLLHLKSSDSALPELSIVIVDGITSGWRSDGCWWGNRYFIEPHLALKLDNRGDALRDIVERLR